MQIPVVYPFKKGSLVEGSNGRKGRRYTIEVPMSMLPIAPHFSNIRNHSATAKPFKEMLDSCRSAKTSSLFYDRNHGIQIAVKKVDVTSNGELAVIIDDSVFEHGGVLDGNHTQHVAEVMQQNPGEYPGLFKASVSVTFYEDYSRKEILDMAIAAGQTRGHNPLDIADASGAFDEVWKHIPDHSKNVIARRTSDRSKPYTMRDVIRLLTVMDNRAFPAEMGVHPVVAYDALNRAERNFYEGEYNYLFKLLPDFLMMEEWIAKAVIAHHGLKEKGASGRILKAPVKGKSYPRMTGAMVEYNVEKPWVFPTLSAFRVFIVDGKWTEDVSTLWLKYIDVLVSYSINMYLTDFAPRRTTSHNSFGRSRELWGNLARLTTDKNWFDRHLTKTRLLVADRQVSSKAGRKALGLPPKKKNLIVMDGGQAKESA